MKNIFFLIFSFLVTFCGSDPKMNERTLLQQKLEAFEFLSKYHHQLHIMIGEEKGDVNKAYTEFYGAVINFDNTNSKTILFQGDSWIESISEIKKSNDLLKKFGEDKKYNIYNSGITSFAPSLMHIQHKILKKTSARTITVFFRK